jgi:GntR family transcriptional repressor for pyruvate dehydrogenase complex
MQVRKSLTETVFEGLLDEILADEFPAGSTLPPEADIAAAHSVSRVTVREALKTLQAGNVVTIRRGIGTFVNPPEEWTSLETVLLYASRNSSAATAAADLIEVRRMVETGAAALAARHRTEGDLANLETFIADMVAASAENDVASFVQADIAFHDIILRASHNLFVPVLFEPLGRLLRDNRTRTSAVPEIQLNAIAMHRGILSALASGDAELSRRAMDKHMDQTIGDLETYILHNSTTGSIGHSHD